MDRFAWSNVALADGETYIRQQEGVQVKDGDRDTKFSNGTLVLTSDRLMWSDRNDPKCCIAVGLSMVVYTEEAPAGAASSSTIILHLQAVPVGSQLRGPVATTPHSHVQLCFLLGGQVEFSRVLQEALARRKWERLTLRPAAGGVISRAGIAGIEKVMQQKHKETDKSISVAFEDMRNLMEKAKEMVALSRAISNKIREKQAISEDETTQFKSYLLSLGISDPVTRDTHGTGSKYYQELARELVTVLLKPLQDCGGVMTLTDVYCRVNRARGLELLSPQDLLEACRLFEACTLPLRLRTFESGVMAVTLVSQSEERLAAEAAKLVEQHMSLSADELASKLGISVILAKERLLMSERQGCLCRDDCGVEGLRFYPNLFLTKA